MSWLLFFTIFDVIILLASYSLVISLKLYNTIYQRVYLKEYNKNYSPNIAIFIPCKGINDHFEENIRVFLQNRYHKAKLFFIVESQHDAAYPIIKRLIKNAQHTYLIVAGLAKSCGQKNHNLLQGIKVSEQKDDVYVFLDSFTTITNQQLRELVLPLSDPNVTVSVGFRWNMLNKNSLGERVHAFMIALQWSIMNNVFFQAVWGGATAIRRENFEKMGVPEYWAKTVVDDMTLVRILQKQRKKSVFVPTCIKETDNTITTIKGAILWFKRQVLYVKFYLRPYWLLAISILLCCSLNIVSFPFLFIYSLLYPGKKIFLFTAIKGIFTTLTMVYCLLLKRSADDHHSKLSWFLLSPLYLVLTGYACLLGVFTKVLRWRGISYHLDYHGYVKKIIRN
jgi:cellulose synthase/poly-beta-1,6-N-acetylglucosamine synthase-like glycosyltransferase